MRKSCELPVRKEDRGDVGMVNVDAENVHSVIVGALYERTFLVESAAKYARS